jgi:hypothetical protein
MTTDVAGDATRAAAAWEAALARAELEANAALATASGRHAATIRSVWNDVLFDLLEERADLALLQVHGGTLTEQRVREARGAAMRALADGRIDDALVLVEHCIRLRDQLRRATATTDLTRPA